MRGITTALVAALVICGCATAPPNTPGAGSGDTYTPVVDMQGVDPARYRQDLGECRTYARSVDSKGAAMEGAIGGAILAAILSAALGGDSQMNTQAATAGGFAGLVGNEGRAMGKQERIIINCMAGRGYRTLDAAMVMPGATPSAAGTATSTPSAVGGGQQIYASQVQVPPSETTRTGPDGFAAEAVAREQRCAETPRASLVAKGPGFETYSVLCSNANVMLLRCEFGNCRPLR